MTPSRLLLLAGCLVLAQTSRGQGSLNWRVYRAGDGLPQSACVSVSVTPGGKVFAKSLDRSFIAELDGYNVRPVPLPETLNGESCVSPSGQLWIMVREGLQEFRGDKWVIHPVPEIAGELGSGRIPIVPLHSLRHGRVLFLFADRLMEFTADDPAHPRTELWRKSSETRLGSFLGMSASRDGGLWIAGERGLAKIPKPVAGQAWIEHLLPGELPIHNLRDPREDEDGGVTMVAELPNDEMRAIVRFDGQNWTIQNFNSANIRRGWRALGKTSWIMTTDSLLEQDLEGRQYEERPEISARQFYDVALEPNGAFWLATSDGLFRYAPATWQVPPAVRQINSPVHCFAEDESGRLWFVSGGKLHSLMNDLHQEYALPALPASNPPAIRAIYALKNGTLLLEAGDSLLAFNLSTSSFKVIPVKDGVRHLRPLGLLKDGTLCFQSSNAGSTNVNSAAVGFERFDGTRFTRLTEPPADAGAIGSGLALFAARNGDLWLAGEKGLAWYRDRKWQTFSASDSTVPDEVSGFIELADGRIWCAARNKVWEFDGQNWTPLRAGFDHINSFRCARDGSVWVADDSGLYRFFQNAWIENGREEGLPAASVREVYEDQRGRIWAGTARGLGRYHPEADPDPPHTFIERPAAGEIRIREDDTVALLFDGRDKWKFTPRERLLYSYRLDERDWSSFQPEERVSYADLPAGKHYFQVRAMDRNGNIDPAPALLEFSVVLPWYREIRLLLIISTGVVVALFFAGLALNRHRQLLRSYAEVERKVAERTRELERASQELLQSQKMNALGTLAAGIAHDFNNILSIVKGSAQIIEDNLENPRKIRIRVDRIKTVVEQGSGIVKAMLGFSRDSDGQPAACHPNDVVEDTIKLLGDRFLREVQIKFKPAPALPEVSVSKDFIQQILLNFIFNAAEAMTEQKLIVLSTVQTSSLPADLVLMPAAKSTGYVFIAVHDSGCGIPPENLPRIFEPFFTTKALSARRGTGLGLSMAYELAKKLQAGLAVESAVGRGSTFTLILPVREMTEVKA